MDDDPYAPFKERAWREVAAIDAQLERGEIDEDGWHRAMADLVVPATWPPRRHAAAPARPVMPRIGSDRGA